MKGSVITPMNCVIALKVVCCDPVAVSPETWRQPGRRQRAEHQRNAAGGVEEVGQRIADVLLVAVEPEPKPVRLSGGVAAS